MRMILKNHLVQLIVLLFITSFMSDISTAIGQADEVMIFQEKIESAREILQADPENIDNYITLARLHSQRHLDIDCYWVTKLYIDAVKIKPNEPKLYSEFASFFHKCRDRERAVTLSQKALELSPEDTSALIIIAEDESYRDRAKASKDYEKVLKLQPENARAYMLLGGLLYKTGDYKKAKEYLERARELVSAEDKYLEQEINGLMKQVDKIAELEKVFAEGTSKWDEYAELGLYYSRSGDNLNRAKEILHTASQKIEEPWRLHEMLGRILKENRKYDEAVKEYQEAIRIAQENKNTVAEYQINGLNDQLGDTYKEMGRLEEALSAYNNAFAGTSHWGEETWHKRFKKIGDIYFRLGEYDMAELAYQHSNDPIAEAGVYRALNKYQRALSVLWRAIRKEPEESYKRHGRPVNKDGKPVDGIWYKANYRLYIELGKTYQEMGQPGKAMAAYWEALKLCDSEEANAAIKELF
ncbi:MAG: tetratricopeptide repeat protein [PVC group bacterium]